RSVKCLRQKGSTWKVKLLGIRFPAASDWAYEVLARVNLVTDQLTVCEDDSEWTPHPFAMRVNIILDPGSALLTVTLLEVPSEVRGISIAFEETAFELKAGEIDDTYELVKEFGGPGSADFGEKFENLVETLESGKAELVFKMTSAKS